MSHSEEAQLLEVGGEEAPKRNPTRGRFVAVALGLVAVIAVVGVNLPQKQHDSLKHLRVTRKALLRAFSARTLKAAAAQTSASIEFLLAQEGAEEPSAMELTTVVDKDPNPSEELSIDVVFKAKEGKGKDLKETFDGMIDFMAGLEDDESEEPGLKDLVTTAVDGDAVTLKVTLPEDEDTEIGAELGDEIPTLTSSLKFGRTFEEIYDHLDDDTINGKVPVVFQGIAAKVEASMAVGALEAFKEVETDMGVESDEAFEAVDALEALSSIAFKTELRYRDPEHIEKLLEKAPSFNRVAAILKGMFGTLPDEARKLFESMKDSANGLDKLQVHGLPAKRRFVMTTKGVHIAPVLSDLVTEETDDTEEADE